MPESSIMKRMYEGDALFIVVAELLVFIYEHYDT